MDIDIASSRINDLRLLLSVYERLYTDIRSTFYLCNSLKPLMKTTRSELNYLEEMRENGEFYEAGVDNG